MEDSPWDLNRVYINMLSEMWRRLRPALLRSRGEPPFVPQDKNNREGSIICYMLETICQYEAKISMLRRFMRWGSFSNVPCEVSAKRHESFKEASKSPWQQSRFLLLIFCRKCSALHSIDSSKSLSVKISLMHWLSHRFHPLVRGPVCFSPLKMPYALIQISQGPEKVSQMAAHLSLVDVMRSERLTH